MGGWPVGRRRERSPPGTRALRSSPLCPAALPRHCHARCCSVLAPGTLPACPKPHPLPRARGMVVVTGREPDSRRPDGAMSSSDAEDDFLDPATPTATQAVHALPLLTQEVLGLGGRGKGAGGEAGAGRS